MEIRGGIAKENIAREFYNNESEAPNQVSNVVIPVFEVARPVHNIVRSAAAMNTTATIYTTPTDKDFFLSHAILNSDDGSAGDGYITITIDGATQKLLYFDTAGTTMSQNQFIGGNLNIKIDRGTNITLTSGGAGIKAQASIIGYTKETLKKSA